MTFAFMPHGVLFSGALCPHLCIVVNGPSAGNIPVLDRHCDEILGCLAGEMAALHINPAERCDGAVQGPQGLDNLLYSADADFSCFADLALTSPEEYYREGQGSLMQCVLTPADPYMPMPNEEIAAKVHQQVRDCSAEHTSSACQSLSSVLI